MATRNGKLANLPNDIREQLNLRLLEGESGRELTAWLNALPAVQSILSAQFHGSPISEVNLTHWRQGGYLQWLTERECFDSARALAEGDGDLAKIGLSAERLLNVLTVRYGQLLMRWDFSPEEDVSDAAAFSAVARKARILQGISRSLLAIHRIQSQAGGEKSATERSSPNSHESPVVPGATAPKSSSPPPRAAAADTRAEPQTNAASDASPEAPAPPRVSSARPPTPATPEPALRSAAHHPSPALQAAVGARSQKSSPAQGIH